MERNRSSRPSGHSRAQMKVEFIREKAIFRCSFAASYVIGEGYILRI